MNFQSLTIVFFSSLLVVSTKVGGIPEVLPPYMIRLAPVSASGLATTLANAVEEIRQQRVLWQSEDCKLTRSASVESNVGSSINLFGCLWKQEFI